MLYKTLDESNPRIDLHSLQTKSDHASGRPSNLSIGNESRHSKKSSERENDKT